MNGVRKEEGKGEGDVSLRPTAIVDGGTPQIPPAWRGQTDTPPPRPRAAWTNRPPAHTPALL